VSVNKLIICILFFSHLTTQIAIAAEVITPTTAKKGRRLKINFEEDLVKGDAEMPDLSNIQLSKQFNFKKMIKMKDNFIPQVESNGELFEK
jgi:hypothetical protein